jgi:hypothetical protein
MGRALQVVTGSVVNPGAAITALTPAPGDSFAVKAYDSPGRADILELWTSNATGGVLRLRSNRLHDNVQGIRLQVPAGNTAEYFPRTLKQRVYSGDPLTLEMSGGGAETDVLSYLIRYTNLDGSDAVYASWAEIQDRIVDYAGVESTLTSGGTAGQYGGTRTLNQDFQNLKADEKYALLGYTCKSNVATVIVQGPDTGNLNIGGPGSTNTDITSDWFVRLSQFQGEPLIPVIKANNAGATTVALASADTATAHAVSWIFARLTA